MNTTTTSAMVSAITATTKFKNVTLTDDGLFLQFEKKNTIQIYFSELDKIYIKVYKLKPIYGFLFVLFPVLFALLYFEYIERSVMTSVGLLPGSPTLVKINRFKRYGLILVLKDGSVYKKKVSKRLKSDTIELINAAKKKCLAMTEFNANRILKPILAA